MSDLVQNPEDRFSCDVAHLQEAGFLMKSVALMFVLDETHPNVPYSLIYG